LCVLLDHGFDAVDDGVDLMFGEVGQFCFGGRLSVGGDEDVALAHEIDQFGLVVAILLPDRVDDDSIHKF
jgi:hypothetical protein